MRILRFKTSIHCGGCLALVSPSLDALQGISKWEVDLNSTDRILEVTSESLSPEDIIEAVRKSGFKIDVISN
jgi:copper chaperone